MDANRAHLETIATTLEESVGRTLADVLTPDLEDRRADGPTGLRESLERARARAARHGAAPAQRHPAARRHHRRAILELPDRAGPRRSGDVVLLLHRADDITDYVRYRLDAGSDEVGGQQWAERVHQAEADLFSRTQELEQANAELLALSERERHTAQSLAGLATTVSALSAADSRAELLRQMFRHGRRALQADVLAVALLEPGGGHLAVVDTRHESGAEPVRRLSIHSPGADGGGRGRPAGLPGGRGGQRGRPPPCEGLAAWAALPLRIGGRPLGSLTVGWERRHVFEDNESVSWRPSLAQCSQAVNRVARRETERRQASATRSLAETLQRSS